MSTKEENEKGEVVCLTLTALDDEQARAFVAAAIASGMVPKSCPCGRDFLTRAPDPLCPPCRERATSAGVQ